MASRGDDDRAFAGVLTRRVLAGYIDFVIVTTFTAVISVIIWAIIVALEMSHSSRFDAFEWPAILVLVMLFLLLFLPIAFFYNCLGISGPNMATLGMKLADLELHMMDGRRVPFLIAAVHTILLSVSMQLPFVFLVSLFNQDKRCLHDIMAGVVVTRRL